MYRALRVSITPKPFQIHPITITFYSSLWNIPNSVRLNEEYLSTSSIAVDSHSDLSQGCSNTSVLWCKPFCYSSGCMFTVVLLLESEPTPLSQFFCSPLLSMITLYLAPSILPSALTSFHDPLKEHIHNIMLLPPCFLECTHVHIGLFFYCHTAFLM